MANQWEIPWAPPDILPGAKFLTDVLSSNATERRAKDYLQFERDASMQKNARESAQALRDKAKFDADLAELARRHDIERTQALPTLFRFARQSPQMGNLAGKPYGVSFDEAPPVAPPDLAKATSSLYPGMQPGESDPAGDLRPMDDHTADPVHVAEAAPGQPPKPKLRAKVGGQSFDVPETSDGTGFGPKYDAVYQRALQEPGVSPEEAFSMVAKMAHEDASEAGKNQRTKDLIAGRDTSREGHEQFLMDFAEKYKLTAEEQKRLREAAIRAQAASSGAAPLRPEVADVVRMVGEGASPEEVYAFAARSKLSGKDINAPMANVVKNAAQAERAGQKREALSATGDGVPDGAEWKNPQAANKGNQQIQRFHRVKERLVALIDDVEKHGERIDFDPKQQVRRQSLAEAVAAALRPYNELSSTDASMKAERAILGPTGAFGHGWALGADLQTLKHILAEAEGQQKVNLDTLLKPAGSSSLAPALGGKRPEGPKAVKRLRMPDGTIAEFDANGSRIK